MSHWPLSLWVNFIILRVELTQLYAFVMYNLYFECPYYHMFLYGFSSCVSLYEWLSIFLWVFVMYIFVRMTIHIILVWVFVTHISVQMTIRILMGFRHAHLCTNDYPFLFVWFFVMHFSVQMTIHIIFVWVFVIHIFCTNDYPYSYGFLSCTSLYEWLSISLCMGFRHAHFCTNDYPLCFCIGFCHSYFCMNDYSYSFCMGFSHAHFYTNDFPYSYGSSSCTSVKEWLFCFQFYFQCVSVKWE